MIFSGLLIIERAVVESLLSSVTHQRKALVSNSTCIDETNFHLQKQQAYRQEAERQNHREQQNDLYQYLALVN
jgi:RNA binding exosome subunit